MEDETIVKLICEENYNPIIVKPKVRRNNAKKENKENNLTIAKDKSIPKILMVWNYREKLIEYNHIEQPLSYSQHANLRTLFVSFLGHFCKFEFYDPSTYTLDDILCKFDFPTNEKFLSKTDYPLSWKAYYYSGSMLILQKKIILWTTDELVRETIYLLFKGAKCMLGHAPFTITAETIHEIMMDELMNYFYDDMGNIKKSNTLIKKYLSEIINI